MSHEFVINIQVPYSSIFPDKPHFNMPADSTIFYETAKFASK